MLTLSLGLCPLHQGRRRRRKQAHYGASRSLKGVPPKLSPYVAAAVRRLPPVKVHVLNPRLTDSLASTHRDAPHSQVATPGEALEVHRYLTAQHPPSLPLPHHRQLRPPPSTSPQPARGGGDGAEGGAGGVVSSRTSPRRVTPPGAYSTSREWLPVAHSLDLAHRMVG